MAENSITDHSVGLNKIVDRINLISTQCNAAYRGDVHKLRFLRKAVIGQPCASIPSSQITFLKLTFTKFVIAVRESLQLQEEEQQDAGAKPFMYQSQYGRHPGHVQKHYPR